MKFSSHVQDLIASFRGLPSGLGRPSNSRKAFPINDILDSVSKKYNIGKHTAQDIIMSNWQHIIGPVNAQRACPSNIDRNILIIKVSNPILRNELQFQSKHILKRLQGLPQCGKIKRINLVSG